MPETRDEGAASGPVDPRRARAEEAMRAMAEGADPADQAFRLSNEFTDSVTARVSAGVKRLFRRKG